MCRRRSKGHQSAGITYQRTQNQSFGLQATVKGETVSLNVPRVKAPSYETKCEWELAFTPATGPTFGVWSKTCYGMKPSSTVSLDVQGAEFNVVDSGTWIEAQMYLNGMDVGDHLDVQWSPPDTRWVPKDWHATSTVNADGSVNVSFYVGRAQLIDQNTHQLATRGGKVRVHTD